MTDPGKGPGGFAPLIFRPSQEIMSSESESLCLESFSLDQTEAQRAKNIFFETAPPPPPPSQGLDQALLHTIIACVQTPPSPKKKSVGRETLFPTFLRGSGRLYTG